MKVKMEPLGKWKGNRKWEEVGGVMRKRVMKGVNMIKVHYMHIWKYHNETPYSI
jgi:hypothetical protein